MCTVQKHALPMQKTVKNLKKKKSGFQINNLIGNSDNKPHYTASLKGRCF